MSDNVIVPTVDHVLGKKEFIYQAEMIDTEKAAGVEQNVLDISRMADGGIIQISGLSTSSLTRIDLKGTCVRTVGVTTSMLTLPVVAMPSINAIDAQLFGVSSASIGAYPGGGISVMTGLSGTGGGFIKVPRGLSQIMLETSGSSCSGVSAKYFGKSY